MPVAYIYLLIAVVAETIATSALQASQQFSRLWPSIVVITGYGAAFFMLSLSLRDIPVGVAYALWSGIGVVLIAGIGWWVFGQKLDLATIVGLALIVAGIVVINLFSQNGGHHG